MKYKKMSLFDAPRGSVLVHACNAQGVWGSGIAKEMKNRFPQSFEYYREHCNSPAVVWSRENGYTIGNLITSKNYGDKVDTPWEILIRTGIALEFLMDKYPELKTMTFYSNKFNSGLFKVPWEKTEEVLKRIVDKYNLKWVVCDPNLEVE